MEIDYKQLLIKYVDVVGMNEGVDFLYPQEWTKEEWEVWCELFPDLLERFPDVGVE